jgi:hypothetical protein
MRRYLLVVAAFTAYSCNGCFVAQAGQSCTDPGELVCGGDVGNNEHQVLLCNSVKVYSREGTCPTSCDHVTGVRTAVGCGDSSIRAVQNSRCDGSGGACSMDLTAVMICQNAVWAVQTDCVTARCGLKPGNVIGCR